jgi:hypothetical protein
MLLSIKRWYPYSQVMPKSRQRWRRRCLSHPSGKTRALDVAIIMTLVIGVTFVLVGCRYGRPWFGSTLPAHATCPRSVGQSVPCVHYRHDLALGSFFVALCYFIAAGALRLITDAQTLLGDTLWWVLLPCRWIAGCLSAPARRFFFDVAIIVTLFLLPSTILSVLPGRAHGLPLPTRWEVGLLMIASIGACIYAVIAYRASIRPHLSTTRKEAFIVGIVLVIWIGRTWAGWTLGGIALTAAVVAGIAALANWLGIRATRHP